MAGSCGGESVAVKPLRAPVAYDGMFTLLFDNQFESGVLGYRANEVVPAVPDQTLRDRVAASDSVVRARAATVTSSCDETGCGWQVELDVVEPLTGIAHSGERVELRVNAVDIAAGTLPALDPRLLEQPVILFLRQFKDASGEPVTGFHATPDRPDELAAVRNAIALTQIR